MKKIIFALFIFLSFHQLAAAQTNVCFAAPISQGLSNVIIDLGGPNQKDIIIDDGSGLAPMVISDYDEVFDGYGFRLITAPGVSIKYMEGFGCIRRLKATFQYRRPSGNLANFTDVEVPTCQFQVNEACNP